LREGGTSWIFSVGIVFFSMSMSRPLPWSMRRPALEHVGVLLSNGSSRREANGHARSAADYMPCLPA
jgi:hypothetical protein